MVWRSRETAGRVTSREGLQPEAITCVSFVTSDVSRRQLVFERPLVLQSSPSSSSSLSSLSSPLTVIAAFAQLAFFLDRYLGSLLSASQSLLISVTLFVTRFCFVIFTKLERGNCPAPFRGSVFLHLLMLR